MDGRRTWSCLYLMDQALKTPHGNPYLLGEVDGGRLRRKWMEVGGGMRMRTVIIM